MDDSLYTLDPIASITTYGPIQLESNLPFAIWGIDLIGMINPHFITTTKFTTKWVEAIPIKSFTQDTFIAFLIEKYHHKV